MLISLFNFVRAFEDKGEKKIERLEKKEKNKKKSRRKKEKNRKEKEKKEKSKKKGINCLSRINRL